MKRDPRLRELLIKRSELKGARLFREAIPFQVEILELLQAAQVENNELAGAHNMASVLYLRAKLYFSAEWHARKALALHSDLSVKGHEAHGAYTLVLAQALASQYEFSAAAEFGQRAIEEYSHWHNPPDEFLTDIIRQVEAMKNRTWVAPE